MWDLKSLIFLMFVLSSLLAAFIPVTAGTSDPPRNIHLTWQRSDTARTITLTWETNRSDSGDTVSYDTFPRNGNPELYSFSALGTSHSYAGASGYIHDVELTGLTLDTVYFFICGGDAGGWSSERAFRTSPSISSDVRFVVGGDSRTNLVERTKISDAMAKFNPAFVMHSGDMVDDGRVQSQWDSWFTDVNDHWIGENNLTIPIIPVLGNHENPQYADCKYFEQLALPGNEKWYSYNWGPDIHIVCLDSESSASGAQRDWLENDLASHANYTWKFVIFHRPPFVTGNHDPWEPALTYWVPLFDEYHVDIVFNGHEHSYQRTYPLNWTASQTEPQDYSNGTVYIVSGGWGAPLYTPEPIWYMAYQNETYHFVLIDVFHNGTLHMQAKDDTGITFDEVWIYGSPPPVLQLTSFPAPFVVGKVVGASFVVGGTHEHGPRNWRAWTVDVLGGIGVAGRLGLDSDSGSIYQFVDTDVATYSDGAVTVDWLMIHTHVISIGSSFVNIFTYAYETHCGVPFYMAEVGGQPVIHSDSTGSDYGSGSGPPGYDHAVIAMVYDGSVERYVMLVYGVTGWGSQAACMVLQNYDAYPGILQGKAVIIRWDDTNANNLVDLGDSISLIEEWS